MREFFYKEWCPSDKCLVIATASLLGIVIGFILSPVKKGIFCGNYNGNTQRPKDKE
ncbi:hypothetical protein [Clostridium sp. chh4-2]|uniref:hypothetical protein n=1 Tax=Clostridium sp. chh4-2 TaxID=2067550 RepID=UPI0015E17C53|nr:hypothetical protein [Clostridium sp. chh4-2]